MSLIDNHGDGPIVNASDEITPLLASFKTGLNAEPINTPSQTTSTNEVHTDDANIPLPSAQVFLLCFTRVVEPIAFFSIFPFVNSMIERIGGIEKEDVGFYSGLIESLFSLTQMCVMILWGKASDRYGRKPVLVFSLLGIAVGTTLFGMSQSIAQMVAARCFAGVFAGTVITVRAMLSENSTQETQAQAFSYFAFAGNLGIFVGPFLGGLLERPAEKYSRIFGYQFFRNYPYALPGIATSIIALSAAITTALFVKETLHTRDDMKNTTETPMTIWELIKSPGVWRVILINNYIMLIVFTYTAVNPVFLYTPIPLGGIGFSPELIAATIGLAGASQSVWLLLAFPFLHRRVGTGQILRFSALVWPVFFAAYPCFNMLLRHHEEIAFWVLAPPIVSFGSSVAMAITAVQLAVNDVAPSHRTFGTLNAIVLAFSSGLRAIAPAVATSVYAAGVKYKILGGQLFWLISVILACGLAGMLKLLPEKAEGRPRQNLSPVA